MATINLGAIKFNWKGAYNSSTSYAVDDVVSSGGNSYVCIQAHSNQAVGNATAYWNIMSSAGTNGTNGTDVGTTLTTQGDILYRDASGLQRLGAGTSGQYLETKGSGQNPVWSTVSTGAYTLAQISDGTSGMGSVSTSSSSTSVRLGTNEITVTPSASTDMIELNAYLNVINANYAKQYNITENTYGLIVTDTKSSSVFEKGDLIIEAEMKAINNIKQLKNELHEIYINEKEYILINFIRQNEKKLVAVKLK